MEKHDMTYAKIIIGGLALAGALFAAPHVARAQAGTVFGGYAASVDANQDHMTLTVNNLTSTAFTNLTVTELLPADINGPAVSDMYNYGTVAANGSLDLDLSFLPDFGRDPAHTFPGIAPLTMTVTAQQGAALLATTFSQDVNATGGYVQFEGIGEGTHAPYQAVAPTRVGVLAPAPVPEAPTTVSLGLFLLGLGGLALRARGRA